MEQEMVSKHTSLLSELLASADEVASLAKDYSRTETQSLAGFAASIEKLTAIFSHDSNLIAADAPRLRSLLKSLEFEVQRARALLQSSNSRGGFFKHTEDAVNSLGQLLGQLLLFLDSVQVGGRDEETGMNADSLNVELEVLSDGEGKDRVCVQMDEVSLQLKYGSDEEFKLVLSELDALIREKRVDSEWIRDEGIVPLLFNRLGSTRCAERLGIIKMLRIIVLQNYDTKELMGDVNSLTTLVKSLARDAMERREGVGLVLELCDLSAVRRRIGRIKGCILMLVTIMNGDDPLASHDAGKILNALSQNTQNALHMAGAGYFTPLVQHLKDGSDTSKILAASALSRIMLTDQSRVSLGENGSIEPLIIMFKTGKLEAKVSALQALKNLSLSTKLVQIMISLGILLPLLQLLFSVTSSLMSLREPAAALLANIAQSVPTLINNDIAPQMLSLLNLSSPVIQCHLLQAVHSIAAHPGASKLRCVMKQNGVIQLLLPFLTDSNTKIRVTALNLLDAITKEFTEELGQVLGEENIQTIVRIVSSSVLDKERAAGVGLLCNIPIGDKKATDMLKSANVLPIMVSILNSSSTQSKSWMTEAIANLTIRFTDPSDKKMQQYAAELGLIPLLVKLLSEGTVVAKLRAATSLAQLSQNSVSLRRSKVSRWTCISPPIDPFCEVHVGHCTVKGNFCLVKAGAVPPLIHSLHGKEREADEAILFCLSTLLQDGIWENGSNLIAKMQGVEAIGNILESGTTKSKEKALWILERIFRVQAHRSEYGEFVQVLLIDLAQKGDPALKSMVAQVLAQLELLQVQSSYF
ncbi:hypothetical protein Dimus_005532 [Dionaea muscipula]